MNILLLVIFLAANLTTVGVTMFSYGDRVKYTRGMIMGVHIPQDMVTHEEVQQICRENKKQWDKFQRINFVLAIGICAFLFISFEWFMVVWCIWLAGYLAYLQYLVITSQKKMYQLKMENHWIDETSRHLVYVDLKTSAMASKMALRWYWHLLVVLVVLISGIWLFSYKNQSMINLNGGVLFTLTVSLSATFILLHWLLVCKRNEVYSENQEINYGMNQFWKRSLSVGLLVCDVVNGISWLFLVIQIGRNDWISGVDFSIYIVLQLLAACFLMIPLMDIQKKKKMLLQQDTEPIYVDDDEYWKNGWYNNPNDKRIMVQDRMSTANFTFNLGNPIGKVLNIGLMLLFVVTLVGTCVLMFSFSNSSAEFTMNGTEVKIKAAMYTCEFDVEEIEVIELLDEMPEENFFKTNGGATEDYSIGYFSGNKSGACMLFLYGEETPVLKIVLPEKTIYVNSEEAGVVKQWYLELEKAI